MSEISAIVSSERKEILKIDEYSDRGIGFFELHSNVDYEFFVS
jgi:hypothetical protein